jgi:hypothetical protein
MYSGSGDDNGAGTFAVVPRGTILETAEAALGTVTCFCSFKGAADEVVAFASAGCGATNTGGCAGGGDFAGPADAGRLPLRALDDDTFGGGGGGGGGISCKYGELGCSIGVIRSAYSVHRYRFTSPTCGYSYHT